MFCDDISDSLHRIISGLRPNRCYSGVYPKKEVINMIASMLLVQRVSDYRLPNGTFFNGMTLDDIRKLSFENATQIYNNRMGEEDEGDDCESTERICVACNEDFTPSIEHYRDTVCDSCVCERNIEQVLKPE
jgi:hypothetical protein